MNDPWSNRHVPSFVSNRTPDDDTASDHFNLISLLVKRISELEAEVARYRESLKRIARCTHISPWNEERPSYEANIAALALLDKPGKEVMPDETGTARPSHDAAPASLSAGGGAGWQPIETIPAQGCVVVGCWVGSRWSWWEGLASDLGCDGEYGDEPTHWMPLPAPPATEGPTDADV